MAVKSRLPYVLVLAAGLGAGLAQAADPPIIISTGKSGGGYNTIGERLKGVLAEQDQPAQVQTSAGSLENLNRLDDPQSPVNVGLTQADALKYYLKDHPGFADKFISLGEIGKECVFIVVGKDSDIRDDGDLQKPKGKLIAVQSPNSGVAVTWEYMTVLEPEFKNTAPAFVDGAEALVADQERRQGQQDSGGDGGATADGEIHRNASGAGESQGFPASVGQGLGFERQSARRQRRLFF
jgi:hypothetical protein